LREAVKTTGSFVALATDLEEALGAQTSVTLRLLAQTDSNLARLRTLGDSPDAREQLAALQALAAKLHLLRGRTDLALAAGNEAVAGYEALRASAHADTRPGLWLALYARARVHSDRGTTGPALADVRRARTVADELAAEQPANYRWQVFQAKSNMLIGALEWAQGRFAEGDKTHAKALEQATAAVNTPEGTGDVQARRLPARAHYNRGAALERREEPGAQAEYLKAHDLLDPLAPGSPGVQADLIDALIAVAVPAHQNGDEVRARQLLVRAEQLADGLLLADPNSAEWQRLRFYAGITRTQTLARGADAAAVLREQLALFERLIPIAERIVRDDPSNAVWRQRLVVLRRSVVMNNVSTNPNLPDAEKAKLRARAAEVVAEGKRLVAADPENYNAVQAAFTTGRVALFLMGQLGGKRTAEDVREVYQPVHDFYARRRKEEPDRAEWRIEAAQTHYDALNAFLAGGHARIGGRSARRFGRTERRFRCASGGAVAQQPRVVLGAGALAGQARGRGRRRPHRDGGTRTVGGGAARVRQDAQAVGRFRECARRRAANRNEVRGSRERARPRAHRAPANRREPTREPRLPPEAPSVPERRGFAANRRSRRSETRRPSGRGGREGAEHRAHPGSHHRTARSVPRRLRFHRRHRPGPPRRRAPLPHQRRCCL
jgi:hypothetical protein